MSKRYKYGNDEEAANAKKIQIKKHQTRLQEWKILFRKIASEHQKEVLKLIKNHIYEEQQMEIIKFMLQRNHRPTISYYNFKD